MSSAIFPSRIHFLIIFLLFLGGQLASVLLIVALGLVGGGLPADGIPDWLFPVTGILGAVPMIAYAWHKAGRPELKLRSEELLPVKPTATIFFATVLISFALGLVGGYLPTSEYLPQIGESLQPGIGMFIAVAVVAPLLEEVLCRGLLLDSLLRKRSPRASILISAAFFGLLHLNPAHVVLAAALGLVLGYVYYRTRSLALVIALHAFNNLLAYGLGILKQDISPAHTLTDALFHIPLAGLLAYLGVRLLKRGLRKREGELTIDRPGEHAQLQPAPVHVE